MIDLQAQRIERDRSESLIGQPATIIPDLILKLNRSVLSVEIKADKESQWHNCQLPAKLDNENVAISNKLMTVDRKPGWLLMVRYFGLSAKNVEEAQKRAIAVPFGWGFLSAMRNHFSLLVANRLKIN